MILNLYKRKEREREKLEQTWSGKNSTRNSIPLLTTFKYLINCYSNLSKSYLYTIICRIKWSRFFIYQQITICRQNILEKTKKRCPSKLVDLSSRILTSFPTIFDSPSLPDHEKNERNAFARERRDSIPRIRKSKSRRSCSRYYLHKKRFRSS